MDQVVNSNLDGMGYRQLSPFFLAVPAGPDGFDAALAGLPNCHAQPYVGLPSLS